MEKSLWDDSHRQWPVPDVPWIMRQTWNNLLLANYPIKLDILRKLVPKKLPLDSFDGMGWIGVVPFHMTGLRLRGVPPVPGTDRFPQINVRTYITLDGKPGVYFFSLDAANWLAAKMAKTFFHIPYNFADIRVESSESTFHFESKRKDMGLVCSYRPISEPFYAEKGSFDWWMVERYCFYTVNKKGVPLRCDILHRPWLLQRAEAEFPQNTMLSMQGMQVESNNPTIHFSKKVEVRAWPLLREI